MTGYYSDFYELDYRNFNKRQALGKNCHRMPERQPVTPVTCCVEQLRPSPRVHAVSGELKTLHKLARAFPVPPLGSGAICFRIFYRRVP
jgi:hypothetical protein